MKLKTIINIHLVIANSNDYRKGNNDEIRVVIMSNRVEYVPGEIPGSEVQGYHLRYKI